VILLGTVSAFNLPVEPVFIILGIDQLMDMLRTSVNVLGKLSGDGGRCAVGGRVPLRRAASGGPGGETAGDELNPTSRCVRRPPIAGRRITAATRPASHARRALHGKPYSWRRRGGRSAAVISRFSHPEPGSIRQAATTATHD
jgi:hypothetical protein